MVSVELRALAPKPDEGFRRISYLPECELQRRWLHFPFQNRRREPVITRFRDLVAMPTAAC
jgi:hypothetical protein